MLGLEPRNPEGADLQSAAVAAVPHPQLPYSCLMRSTSVRLKRKQWNVTTRSRACQQKRSNTRVRAYLHHSLTPTCALACCSNAGSIPTHMKRARCRGPQAPWSQRQESAVGGADRIRFGPPALARCAGRRSRVAQRSAFAGSIPTHMKRARCRQRQRARKLPGASDRNRTCNPLITNQLLYR